eukprot:TRINITY_DN3971_c0_g1_i1.p1 TRINITY_DN3971_c0_g1~~TRINITY_DN3971_c0_g1_i1.p1  ORF type:complete len:1327 (+),score=328.82 TRINITY_DN3971_c0_g1_i1:492-3983(+)
MIQKSKAAKAVRDSIQQELQKQKCEEQNIRSALRHAADVRRSEFQNDEKRREREKMLFNHLEFRRRLEQEESKKSRRASADVRPPADTRTTSVTRSQSDGALKKAAPSQPPPPPPPAAATMKATTDIPLSSNIASKDSSSRPRKKVSFQATDIPQPSPSADFSTPFTSMVAEPPTSKQRADQDKLGNLKNEPQQSQQLFSNIDETERKAAAEATSSKKVEPLSEKATKTNGEKQEESTTKKSASPALTPTEPPMPPPKKSPERVRQLDQKTTISDDLDKDSSPKLFASEIPAASTSDITLGNTYPTRGRFVREEVVEVGKPTPAPAPKVFTFPKEFKEVVEESQPAPINPTVSMEERVAAVSMGEKVVCSEPPPSVQGSALLSSPKNERKQVKESVVEEIVCSDDSSDPNPLKVPPSDGKGDKRTNTRHPIPPKEDTSTTGTNVADIFPNRSGSSQSRTRFRFLKKEKTPDYVSPKKAPPVSDPERAATPQADGRQSSPRSGNASPKGSSWQSKYPKRSTPDPAQSSTYDYLGNSSLEALRRKRSCISGCVSGAVAVAVMMAVSKMSTSKPEEEAPPLMKDGSVASLRQVVSDCQAADRSEKTFSKIFRSRQHPATTAPSSTESASRLREAANTQYKSGKYSEAIKGYTQAIVCTPDNALLYMNRSAAYMAMGLFQDALNDASYASKLENDNPKIFFRMAKLNLLTGNPVAARLLYSTARKLAIAASATELLEATQNEAKALELIESSLRHREHHRWRQALTSIDQAILLLPCLFFQQLRCEALIMVDPRKAAEDLKLLAETHKTVADIHYLYAKALFYSAHDKIGTNTALQELGISLSLDHSHPKGRSLHLIITSFEKYRDEGNTAFEQRRWKVAQSAYTKALALDPNNYLLKSTILLNRAAVQYQQGFIDAAKEDCTASILFDDENYKAYVKRAKCHMQQDNCTLAVRDLKTAYKINPSSEILTKLKQAEDLTTRKYGSGTEFYCRGRGPGGGSPPAAKPEAKKAASTSNIPKRRTAFKAFNTSAASDGDADGGSTFRKTANGFDFKKFTKSDPNDFFFEFKNNRARPQPKTSRPFTAAPKQSQPAAKTLYDTLGIPRSANASAIKAAYHKEALRWHPDKWINATKEEGQKAEVRFKEISQAYATLSDPAKRKGYDMAKTV